MTPPPSAASATPPALCAAELAAGECAVVAAVKTSPRDAERLAALGLVPGARLEVLRAGATLAVAVGATRLALGRSWARALVVVRC